jgi:hypothetical protein
VPHEFSPLGNPHEVRAHTARLNSTSISRLLLLLLVVLVLVLVVPRR